MESYDPTFGLHRKVTFDQVPVEHKVRLFDVDYVHLRGMQSGDLFVTRDGWPFIDSVMPTKWFVGNRFSRVGRALAGATGAVYRVPVDRPHNRRFALVVKFSRCGQDTQVTAMDPLVRGEGALQLEPASTEFLSPFEEFANLLTLRNQINRPAVFTQRPLAIYSPATRYLEWELGRRSSLQEIHTARLLNSQARASGGRRIDYDWQRIYILLYHWIDGVDAVQAVQAGLLSQTQMTHLNDLARQRLLDRGFVVVDHKPRHVIVRPRPNGAGLLRRGAQIAWALVDYELLLRIPNRPS